MTDTKILDNLISIDSQCTRSNEEIVRFLENLFGEFECKKFSIKKPSFNVFNLMVRIPGNQSNRPLIFSGHTDTVPVADGWTKNPFIPFLKGDRIYGLGSTDMKGGIASFSAAVLALTKKPAQDIYLLFDADEEGELAGGMDFIKKMNFDQCSPNVIIAEPTNCLMEVGQNGNYDIKVTFSGQSFHSSRTSPFKTKRFSAIDKARRFMNEIDKLSLDLAMLKDGRFGSPKVAVCQIEGGSAPNVIPGSCSLVVNRRIVPSEDMNAVYNTIRNIARKIDNNCIMEILFNGPPFVVDQQSGLFRRVASISRQIIGHRRTSISAGWTQAGLFKKWGPCLIWGPGVKDMCHKIDEYTSLKQIYAMTRGYRKLISMNE